MSNTLIKVEIGEGMFSNENSVSIKLKNGGTVSLFASSSLIRNVEGQYLLAVNLFDVAGTPKVLLPSETFETSSRWIEVGPEIIS